MSYVVVEFSEKDGGGVAIVNKSWLTPRKREVLWPPLKDQKTFDKYIIRNVEAEEDCKVYSISRCSYETEFMMPRKYKRKLGSRQYKNYSDETLLTAIYRIIAGEISMKDGERLYSIPYRTLWNKINGKHNGKVGGLTILSELEERHSVDVPLASSEFGSPLSCLDVRHVVKRYLDRSGKRIPLMQDNFPGREWVLNFLDRNKDKLTQRSCQNIKSVSAEKTEEEFVRYFDNLEGSMDGIPAANVMNYDETNLSDDPGTKKCVFKRGTKYPERLLNATKSSICIMFAVTGDCETLPPYVVYKADRIYDQWTLGGPPGTRYNRTKSGRFDTYSFEDWFATVVIPWASKKDGPKLLIGDNLSSHLSLNIIQSCQKYRIRFVFLPANSTHLCQPLDVGYNGPLKKQWRKILTDYTLRNPKEKAVKKSSFPHLLKKLVNNLKYTDEKNIKSAFRACGILPLNRNKVLKKLPNQRLPENVHESISGTLLDYLKEIRSPSTNTAQRVRKKMARVAPGKSMCAEDFELPNNDESDVDITMESEDWNENVEPESDKKNEDVNQTKEYGNMMEEENDEQTSETRTKRPGDFVVVAFPTKKSVRHFIGKVVSVLDDEFNITFLMRQNKGFVFPLVEDVSLVPEMDIMKILPPP